MRDNDLQSYAALKSKRKPSAGLGKLVNQDLRIIRQTLLARIAKAAARVVVDHASGLHESVADGGSGESETAAFEVFAHLVRFACTSGQSSRSCPSVFLRLPTDELPDVAVKSPELSLYRQECLRVGNCGSNFQTIAHNAGVGEKRPGFPLVIAGDFRGIEPVERSAVILALVEDCLPAQTGLCTLQD